MTYAEIRENVGLFSEIIINVEQAGGISNNITLIGRGFATVSLDYLIEGANKLDTDKSNTTTCFFAHVG